MFDDEVWVRLAAAGDAVGAERLDLMSGAELGHVLRRLRPLLDRLEGVQAEALSHFDQAAGFEADGAASTAGWARRELRLDAKEARAQVRAGRTLRRLPEVREASRTGSIRLAHVKEFTAGLTKLGVAVMADAQDYLVPVAQTCDPHELRSTIGRLEEVVRPESLDQAYADGMDKADVQLSRCGDGFHLTGFLDIATGTSMKTWLDAASAPRDADDVRTSPERRVDAIGELMSTTLAHGMPSDTGVRPRLHVTVEAGRIRGDDPLAAPARLAGFGSIGDGLLGYLSCGGEAVGVLVDGETSGPTPQADVLNVGRSTRLATDRQRTAVLVRQDQTCASPGCSHTHLEVHHVAWWGRDLGRTDLDNLVGLCSRCHHLVHAGRLVVETDGHRGFTFRRGSGPRLRDHYREHRARIRRHLARLRDSARPTRAEVDARRQTYASRLEGHLLHLIRRPDLRLRT